jgi:hypothetical protein
MTSTSSTGWTDRPGREPIPATLKNKEVTIMLKKIVLELYREPCNCGSQIRHHNGGNYHSVDRLHLIGDEDGVYCSILEETTTREDFPGDRYDVLTFQDGEFRLEDEEWVKEDEIVRVEGWQVPFRQGEAKIVYQNPQAFVDARKPHAEELADTARAFGHEVSWEEFLLDA